MVVKIAGQKIDVEFRADAKQFHNEIKSVQKELRSLRSEWSKDDRATRSYSSVGDRIKKSFESTSKQYRLQEQLVKDLNNEMARLSSRHGLLAEQAERLRVTQGEGSKEYIKAREVADQYGKKLEGLTPILQEQEKELDLLGKRLYGVELSYNSHFNMFSKLGRTFDDIGQKFNNFSKGLGDFGMALAPLSLGLGVFGKSSYDAFKKYEMGIVGVQKTTNDLQGKALEKFKSSINEIAMTKPLPISDLLRVSELGGQLDIAKDYLADFSEVINELAMTTDLNVEDASLKLAQLMNVMGTDNKDIRKLGNVINELGNNTATTEQNIVDFSHRLMAVGRQVGLTESDVMALGATLGATGAQVEAGGSNMSKTLLEMSFAINGADEKATAYKEKLRELGLTTKDVKNASKEGGEALENLAKQFGMNSFELEAYNKLVTDGATSIKWFAKASGKSADEFARIWKNDPMEALKLFVKGLHDMEQRGESAAAFLEQMGITNLRQRDTLLKLASGYDVLANASERANSQWENGNALAEEAGKFYETQEGKIQKIRNQIELTKISIGEKLAPIILEFMKRVEGLVTGFNNLSDGSKDFLVKAGAMIAILSPLALGVATVSKSIGTLFSGLGSLVGESGLGGLIGKAKTGKGAFDLLGKSLSDLKDSSSSGLGSVVDLLGKGVFETGALVAKIGAVGLALKGLKEIVSYEFEEYRDKKNWNVDPKALTGDVVKSGDRFERYSKGDVTRGGVNAGLSWNVKNSDEVFRFSETTKVLMTKAEERNQSINNILSKGYSLERGLHKQAYSELKDLITESDSALTETRANNQKRVLEMINDLDIRSSREKVENAKALGDKINAYYEQQTESQKLLYERRGEILEELVNAQGQKRLDLLMEWQDKEREWKALELEEYAQNEDEKIILEQRLNDFRIEQGKETFNRLIEQAKQTRDETIRLAEEQYDNVLLQANKMLQAGSITKQEYESMIELAKEARDKTVNDARSQMDSILATLSQKLPGITLLWDEATSSIKIKYEDTGKVVDATSKNIAKALEYAGSESNRFAGTFGSAMSSASQDAQNLINQLRNINGIKLSDKTMRIHRITSFSGASPASFIGASRPIGSFMAGIANVPYNDMLARLHEGERVLTKEENRVYNMLSSSDMLKNLTKLTKFRGDNVMGDIKNTNEYKINVNLDNVSIKDDRDIRQLTKEIANQLRKEVALGI